MLKLLVIGAMFVTLGMNGQNKPSMPKHKSAQIANTSGVWSEYRIIDIHAHIGSFKGYDLSTSTLMSNITRYGIRLAFISNIDGAELPETQSLDEIRANQATVECVRQHPNQLRGLVWTRPEDGSPTNVEPFLRDSISTGPDQRVFVGMKFHPDMNHFPADDPRVDGYLQLCGKYQIPAVFHSGSDDSSNSAPQKIYAAARRHPAVPIILYHMGFLGPHGSAIATVKDALTKKDAQLYLETSQADPAEVLQAIKEFGSDRVLFGTDATYYGKNHYEKYEAMMTRLQNELSVEDFAKVVRENAEKLFRLKR
jgi:predicted TIM-barrel fold metal-dependent hydrolase